VTAYSWHLLNLQMQHCTALSVMLLVAHADGAVSWVLWFDISGHGSVCTV
jgi:hypothetical protein